MVGIVNYGLGNLASVKKTLDFLKIDSIITDDHTTLREASHLILPGVGSFQQGMANLREKGLDEVLTEEVIVKKKPFLGICLGMQLIFSDGEEPVPNKGLGWIEGSVMRFKENGLRIPHMGWNSLNIKDGTYFDAESTGDVYFIHTYHAVPKNNEIIAATVNYGAEVVASVKKDNIFATQFHPEKSQEAGLTILRSYFEKNA